MRAVPALALFGRVVDVCLRALAADLPHESPCQRQMRGAVTHELFLVWLSAFGTKRKCRSPSAMSAFGGKADVTQTCADVRY